MMEEEEEIEVTAENAEAIAEWLIDDLVSDLACGAGPCGEHDWEKIAQVEALTGRDLYKEALQLCR